MAVILTDFRPLSLYDNRFHDLQIMKWYGKRDWIKERLQNELLWKQMLSSRMPTKLEELIPEGTKVIWTRPSHRVHPKVVNAIVKRHCIQKGSFLNYEVQIEGQKGVFAAYHADLKVIKS